MAASIFIRPFHYLFRYKRNIEELRYELRDIEITRNEVRLSIYKAAKDTKNSNDDAFDGGKWLRSGTEILDKAWGVLEDYESKEGCLYGWCPSLICRCLLSRKAERMAESIADLQGTADTYLTQDSAAPSAAPNSAALSTEMFASKAKAIVNALSVEHINLVGLYGAEGTGKTSVVTNVWKTAINEILYDEIGMVNGIGNLSVTLIQDKVAFVLGLSKCDNIIVKHDQLYHRLNRAGRKTLIVLDDVWQAFDMREVGIPVGDKCHVIVVSGSEEICIQMGSKMNFCMQEFLPRGGWEIFKRGAGKWVEKAGLHSIAKELVEDCGELNKDFGALGKEVESRIDKIKRLIASSLYVAVNEHILDIEFESYP